MADDELDAVCFECYNATPTHGCVDFGTFICADCAKLVLAVEQEYELSIKSLFNETWDKFQIN